MTKSILLIIVSILVFGISLATVTYINYIRLDLIPKSIMTGQLIYKSSKFNYQFSYPSNLVVSPNKFGNYLEQVNLLADNEFGPWVISVFVEPSQFKNMEDWINKNRQNINILSRFQISGLAAVVTNDSGLETDPNQKTLSLIKNNVLYQFSYRFINEEQFLSSIKFY